MEMRFVMILLYVKQNRMQSFGLTSDSYSVTSDQDRTELSKFEMGDEQAEILHKGKVIEKFINEWKTANPPDTCFQLLQVLFRLFKSEISANITLRKGMMAIRKKTDAADKYDQQMTRLFDIAQKYNQKASTLSEILSIYKQIRGKANETTELPQWNEKLRQLKRESQEKQRQLQDLSAKLEEQKKIWQEKSKNQAQSLDEASKIEHELADKLYSLELENRELLAKLSRINEETDETTLRTLIDNIDSRMREMQERIKRVNEKEHQKTTVLREQLRRLAAETDEMNSQKEGMERALDLIHERIDMLTNPLTACEDTSLSPHLARVRLGEMLDAVDQKRCELEQEEMEINELVKKIQSVKATMKSVSGEIDHDERLLQELVKERDSKESEFREVEAKRMEVCEKTRHLEAIERTKRSVEADNIRLRQELESLKAKTRHLVISHHSLVKSADENDASIVIASREREAVALSKDDSAHFDDVLSCFKRIREAYHLTENTSLREILNAVRLKLRSQL